MGEGSAVMGAVMADKRKRVISKMMNLSPRFS